MSDASEPPQEPEDAPPTPNEAQPEEAGKREPSAEEQMAQFEDALKEEDWGHQPC